MTSHLQLLDISKIKMLKTSLFVFALTVASLVSFSSSASAVVLGDFNGLTDEGDGWTRTNTLWGPNSAYNNTPFTFNGKATTRGYDWFRDPNANYMATQYYRGLNSPRNPTATLSKTQSVGVAGETINLSFDIDGFTGWFGSDPSQLNVKVNDTILGSFKSSYYDSPIVVGTFARSLPSNKSFSFISQGNDNYTFEFVVGSGMISGFNIDNVVASVETSQANVPQTPEPAETAGLILFGGAAVILKRKLGKAKKPV